MTGVRQMLNRVTQDPMNFAAAMAAGFFAPNFLKRVLPSGMKLSDQILELGSGAVTYYMLDPFQDSTSMLIGAGAGYAGPLVAGNMGLRR